MFRLCSNDSSVLCRCPTPRGRACGPYGLSLLPPSSRRNPAAGISEVSRFSCMKFLGVSGVFDYAGPNKNSRYRPCPFCLPCIAKTSASGLHLFGAQWPTPPVPLFTLRCAPHGTQCKTRGRVDRYSFLVGFLPPLLHTGLSRRTVMRILQQLTRVAHNSRVFDPSADPPSTLLAAEEKFRTFLATQDYPTTICWLMPGDVVADRNRHIWVRKRGTEGTRYATLQYSIGLERNCGVELEAVCATETETFASVFVPEDDLDAQRHLMGTV
jgi:hypothetical protein